MAPPPPDTHPEHDAPDKESQELGLEPGAVNGSGEKSAQNAMAPGLVWRPTRDFLLAYSAILAVVLAVAFDATTLAIALPTMSEQLGGTALQAFWSGTSFLLASCVLQPTVAALSNIFGRKYMIYVCCIFFAAGSIVAALANDFTIILVGRTLQGAGGGGLIALSEVLITDMIPLAVRGQWFSGLSGIWAIGTVTGPLIGAGCAQNIGWRYLFWINVPIIGIGALFVILFLRQVPIPGHTLAKLGRFDWIGSIIFTVGATSLLFGITTGGVMYSWSSWRTLLPLIISVPILCIFALWELRFASNPMIDRGIFNNRDMIIAYVATVCHGIVMWSMLYFLVLYYLGVKFFSPVLSAVALLPETLTVAPAGLVVGVIAGMTGYYRWSLWLGWVLTTLGSGLLYVLAPGTSTAAWIWLNIPIGIGTGMLFPAMGLTIQAACRPALNGQATAFFSFLRAFGQAIGVAVAGVIFQNAFYSNLLAIPQFAPLADQYSSNANSVVFVIQRMASGTGRDALVNAYNDALRVIWLSLIAFSAFSLVISLFVRGYSLQQEHVTEQHLVSRESKPAPSHRDPESGQDS